MLPCRPWFRSTSPPLEEMNGSPVGCMSWIDQSHLQISQCRGGKPPAKLADSQARCQDDAGAFVLHHAEGNVSLASGRLRRWEERKDRGLSVPYSSKSEQIQTSNRQSVPSIIGSSRRSLDFSRGSARTGTSCLLKRGIRTIQRSACCLLASASVLPSKEEARRSPGPIRACNSHFKQMDIMLDARFP